eukprot:1023610-Rhodomonas_salina.5
MVCQASAKLLIFKAVDISSTFKVPVCVCCINCDQLMFLQKFCHHVTSPGMQVSFKIERES